MKKRKVYESDLLLSFKLLLRSRAFPLNCSTEMRIKHFDVFIKIEFKKPMFDARKKTKRKCMKLRAMEFPY